MDIERAELVVKIALSVDRAGDLFDRDVYGARKPSIWAFLGRFFRKGSQLCILSHQSCPECFSPGVCP